MTKSQKIFLVVLLIVVILYVAVVVFGLAKKDDQFTSGGNASLKSPAWTATLNKWLGGFAPRVSLETLTCNGKKVSEYFELSASMPECVIDLEDGLTGDEDFWKTDIFISPQNSPKPNVYFLAKYPATEDGTPPKIPKDCKEVDENKVDSPGWLGIELSPDDEEATERDCWLKSDNHSLIGLTLIGSAKLRVFCWECTEDNKKKIKLRLNP